MKIFYFITTVGHGKGGHFHSLNAISNEMAIKNEVYVINIGVKPSEVFSKGNFNFTFIRFNGYNFFSVLFQIFRKVKKENPDILHAFDVESYSFINVLSIFKKKVIFLNKCGGPNPKGYFPNSPNLVLFSKENFNFFKNKVNFQNSKLFLIPNRVEKVEIDPERLISFKNKHGDLGKTLLRISRIAKHYESSIIQSINLIHWLINNNIDVKLIIIGTIQSNEVYEKIKSHARLKAVENKIIFETSDEFTNNAKELLTLGNLIIGTGRNFMEASSLDIPLLVPSKEGEYPILVDQENFNEIFATNFSPRTTLNNFNNEKNLELLKNVLEGRSSCLSKSWFDEFFSIDKVNSKYTDAYLTPNKTNLYTSVKGVFVDIIYSIKPFILNK